MSRPMMAIALAFCLLFSFSGRAGAFKQADVDRLLSTKECHGCDLSGAKLEDASLSGADLKGADLEGANLEGASLE